MILLVLSIAWAALVAWLIARAVRQYGAYEKISEASAPPAAGGTALPTVAVIVPVRNEEMNIGPCLRSLRAQDYPADRVRIIVMDDGSQDGTREEVLRAAAGDARVSLVTCRPLASGWKGKPNACWHGAECAADAEWLCFLDADTRSQPALLRSALAVAESRGIDMLSLEPFQQLCGFWDRLIIPAGFFLAAFTQDLRRVNDPALPDATANGQCIFIRRAVYEQVGGHAAVRGEIAEDSALARRVKHAGKRLAVLGAESLLTTRMYRDLAGLWEGISKNVVEMVGGPGKTVFFAAAAVVLAVATLALPAAAGVQVAYAPGWPPLLAAGLATAASLAMFGIHIGGAVYLRIPFFYGLLFPFAYCTGAVLALDALRRRRTGRLAWKGRVYASAGGAG